MTIESQGIMDADQKPIPLLLTCPIKGCGARHIDVGEFATKPHRTHVCQACGHTWRPANVATVGVQFLPGMNNTAPVRCAGGGCSRPTTVLLARQARLGDRAEYCDECAIFMLEPAGSDPWVFIEYLSRARHCVCEHARLVHVQVSPAAHPDALSCGGCRFGDCKCVAFADAAMPH